MLITPFTKFTEGHRGSFNSTYYCGIVLCVVSVYAADARSVCDSSVLVSVVMYGALVSVSVLRRLRSCRHIIIIIIIIIIILYNH